MLGKCSSYIPQEAKHSRLLLSLWELYLKKRKKFKNSLLVYYWTQKPKQTQGKELKHFEAVVRQGPFWVLFPGRAADKLESAWGTRSEELWDVESLASLVCCCGSNSFLGSCFSLRTHPFPFLCFSRLLPVVLRAVVRLWLKCCDTDVSVESSDCRAGFLCSDAWQISAPLPSCCT